MKRAAPGLPLCSSHFPFDPIRGRVARPLISRVARAAAALPRSADELEQISAEAARLAAVRPSEPAQHRLVFELAVMAGAALMRTRHHLLWHRLEQRLLDQYAAREHLRAVGEMGFAFVPGTYLTDLCEGSILDLRLTWGVLDAIEALVVADPKRSPGAAPVEASATEHTLDELAGAVAHAWAAGLDAADSAAAVSPAFDELLRRLLLELAVNVDKPLQDRTAAALRDATALLESTRPPLRWQLPALVERAALRLDGSGISRGAPLDLERVLSRATSSAIECISDCSRPSDGAHLVAADLVSGVLVAHWWSTSRVGITAPGAGLSSRGQAGRDRTRDRR
jgi:hypothetical protein